MPIQTYTYLDVKEQAIRLRCNIPQEITLLPENFDTARSKEELVYASSCWQIRDAWQRAGLIETTLEQDGEQFPSVLEKAFGNLMGPVIFISAAYFSHNPDAVNVALNVASTYIADWLRRAPASSQASLDVVVEKAEGYKRVHYEGDAEGLKEIPRVLREMK